MRTLLFRSLVVCFLLVTNLSIFSTPISKAAAEEPGVYYLDPTHAQAMDSAEQGSINQPWGSFEYSLKQLKPGDTLLIRGGVYKNTAVTLTAANSGTQAAPITVKAYPGETVIFRGGAPIQFQGANWWTFEKLVYENFTGAVFRLGAHTKLGDSKTIASEHITVRNSEFRNGTNSPLPFRFANHILIEGNYFHHIRPGTPFRDANGKVVGWEVNVVDVKYVGNNIIIRNNRFEDIGSDGVQLGAQSYLAGSDIRSVTIAYNKFWVNRPYQGILGNVGENAIDIKKVNGPIRIVGNTIHGFRPTTAQQDASGANGAAITLHDNATNITVARNRFYDNTIHLVIAKGTDGAAGGTRDITVYNNIFQDARISSQGGGYAVQLSAVANVTVYHNTFYNNDIAVTSQDSTGAFKNNVIHGGKVGSVRGTSIQANYNAWCQVSNVPSALSGGNDLRVNDLVLNANYVPRAGSPVINAGVNVGVTDDFRQAPRNDGRPDIGAFEYGTSALTSFGQWQVFLPIGQK